LQQEIFGKILGKNFEKSEPMLNTRKYVIDNWFSYRL
jgi:hypothetical protein